eukprot:358728-Chlamydomonas_euryale.AAC.2
MRGSALNCPRMQPSQSVGSSGMSSGAKPGACPAAATLLIADWPACPRRKCSAMTGAVGVTSVATAKTEASGRTGVTLTLGRTPSLQTARSSTPPANGRCAA